LEKSNPGGFSILKTFDVESKKNAILDYFKGVPTVQILRKYGIKGSATIYEWIRLFKLFGIEGLKNQNRIKTSYDYSFKIKVIKWRLENHASFPVAAKRFKIRAPNVIWQWERALLEGRLKPNRGRRNTMTKKPRTDDEKRRLQEENDYLRVRVAYLEKLHALAQKKKKSQTKKKPG
jgi:transposase